LTDIYRRTFWLFPGLLSIWLPTAGIAQTELMLKKTSAGEAGVFFSNAEPVAAIQFTVNSTGPVLVSVTPGARVEGSSWILSSNRINESVINVVLVRSGSNNLLPGSGPIASISVSGENSGRISLSRVVVASPDAQALAANLPSLEWSDTPATLGQNYPNPFNPVTTIPYTIEQETTVKLAVYDVTGREISQIIHDHQSAGSYTAIWNGLDQGGFRVPSGVYFVRLQAGDMTLTKKMILTR